MGVRSSNELHRLDLKTGQQGSSPYSWHQGDMPHLVTHSDTISETPQMTDNWYSTLNAIYLHLYT